MLEDLAETVSPRVLEAPGLLDEARREMEEYFEGRRRRFDLKVDLDVENPRDFPYLGYFSDAKEWMILVRQPECWRFLYPVFEGQREFTDDELREKAMAFIGGFDVIMLLAAFGTYEFIIGA